jgi:hypothetical protein
MKLTLVAAAVALAFAGAVQAQTTPGSAPSAGSNAGTNRAADRDMKKAEHERIEAAYKADKSKCDTMKGNQKDVCMKEAKGKQEIAEAELDAKNDPSAHNQRKVEEARAKAKYEVAKEKCDDMKGKEKDACEHQAKADFDQAKAGMQKSSSSGSSAPQSTAGKP